MLSKISTRYENNNIQNNNKKVIKIVTHIIFLVFNMIREKNNNAKEAATRSTKKDVMLRENKTNHKH